jgi:hypothetical protein
VLFEQEGDCVLSLVGPPASHGHHEESKHRDVHDRGSPHYRLNGARESTSAEQRDTTAVTSPRPRRPPFAPATTRTDARVQRRDRLAGVIREYVLAE